MTDSSRGGWELPVLLAVATAAAGGFAFLYFTRPNTVRVVVATDDGKPADAIHVVVAEAPLPQKDVVAPGPKFTGVVHYASPYLHRPHLKLTAGKRAYDVVEQTEMGFTWAARPLPDDFREPAKPEAGLLEKLIDSSLEAAWAQGKLKPGLVFEGFAWEAKGLRAPPSALPPKTFEQKGSFISRFGTEGEVSFAVPYAGSPNVELGGSRTTIVTSVKPTGFKWKNAGDEKKDWMSDQGSVTFTAKGVLGPASGK